MPQNFQETCKTKLSSGTKKTGPSARVDYQILKKRPVGGPYG